MPDAPDEPENQLAKPVTPASTANARFESGGQSSQARRFNSADVAFSEACDRARAMPCFNHQNPPGEWRPGEKPPAEPLYAYVTPISWPIQRPIDRLEWQPPDMFNYVDRVERWEDMLGLRDPNTAIRSRMEEQWGRGTFDDLHFKFLRDQAQSDHFNYVERAARNQRR